MEARPLRVDGYVRVSQVRGRSGDSFISPSVQRDRIEAWVSAFGHQLVEMHEELDQSGARADRPELLRVIERVERGDIDGVVVAKLDRFARSLIDGLQLIERIQKAGGTFVSVADGLDLTTDTGRLVLRIMLSLAEFELDRVRGNWRDAKTKAVMRGIHPSAAPPFGYRRDGRGGPLLPDTATAPLVTELFRRRLRGAGPTELADWLTAQGARSQRGNAFSHRAIKDILRNDVYIGVASAGDIRNEEAHEPLIDAESFAAVQWAGVQVRPRTEEPSPIRPLLRCAGCRYAMRAENRALANGKSVWYFTCRTRSTRTAWECEQPAAIRDDGTLEQIIVDRFLHEIPAFEAAAREASPRLAEVEEEATRARVGYERWRDDVRVQERLGMDSYLAGLDARKSLLDEALAHVARERARVGAATLPFTEAELREQWPTLSKVEQRDLLSTGIVAVFVRGSSRTAPLDDRLRFVLRGEEVDLPSRGDRGWVARPFPFDD